MRFSFKKALATVLSIALVLSTCVCALTVGAATPAGSIDIPDAEVELVDGKFTTTATINFDKAYEISYVAYQLDLPEDVTLVGADSTVEGTEFQVDLERDLILVHYAGSIQTIPVRMTFATALLSGSFDIAIAAAEFAEATEADLTLSFSEEGSTITIAHECVAGEAVTENEVAATCTTAGSYDTVTRCTVCNEIISSVHTDVDALGHAYDDGVVTTTPDCVNDGVKTYTCGVCGDKKTEAVSATGHTAGAEVTEKEVEATCTTDGSYDTVVYCSVCNAELSRETTTVEAPGHNYVDGKCDVCGEADPDAKALAIVDLYDGSNKVDTYEYETFEEALKSASVLADTEFPGEKYYDPKVTLNKDVALTADVEVGPYIVVDLGDYTVDKGDYDFLITANAKVNSNSAIPYFQGLPFIVEKYNNGVYTYTTNVQLNLNNKNLTVSDQIYINFQASKTISYTGDLEFGFDYYLIEKPEEVITFLPEDFATNTSKTFKVSTNGIPAKDLSNSMIARYWAKAVIDGVEYYAYSNTVEYSVVIYAQAMFRKSSDEKLKVMLKDLLNYGACFQIYKGHRTHDLANAILDEADKVLPTAEELQADPELWKTPLVVPDLADYSTEKLYIGEFSLELLDVINIKYKLNKSTVPAGLTPKMCVWTKAEYEALTKDCTSDEEISAVLTTANCNNVLDLVEGTNYFLVEGIASKKYADTIVTRMMFVDTDGTTLYDWLYSYSPIAYCTNKITSNKTAQDLKDTCRALMVFAKSAREKFGYTVDAG